MLGKSKISFGKFDLHALDKQCRPSETNEEVGAFGKFGNAIQDDATESNKGIKETQVKISEVDRSLKARSFELQQLVEDSKKLAHERNVERLEKLELMENKEVEESGVMENKEVEDSGVPPITQVLKTPNYREECDSEDEIIGPPIPPQLLERGGIDIEEDSEQEEEEEENIFPVSHELVLSHGPKAVSALAVDPSGSRLVSGGIDYGMKFWDFQGMDLAKESFRSFKPCDGYPINNLEYSCSGDKVLMAAGSVQAKVYDRDGVEIYECARGDMYLHDMAKTKGHTIGLISGTWHPKNKEEFLTCGRDGTCRIWNTSKPLQQAHVIKPKASNGLKTNPTACVYSRDGLIVACACDDGSIQMWDHRKTFVNTSVHIRNAHDRGTDTSCITFSYDNKAFATRGGDETLKLWDIRNSKQPLLVKSGLFSRFTMTECVFSPSDKLLLTGTSVERGEAHGKIMSYDRNSGDLVKEMDVGHSHVIRIIWHPRLNQILLGCGDGQIVIYYDDKISRNGAILVAGKRKKRAKQMEIVHPQQVITPHALPLFREERHKSSYKVEEKVRKNPLKSHQPELPLGKTGSGGRVSTGGSTLSSFIIRNMGIRNKVREEVNPREALLKYAKEAENDPYWVSPAYAKTQPKTIFQTETEDGRQIKKQKKE